MVDDLLLSNMGLTHIRTDFLLENPLLEDLQSFTSSYHNVKNNCNGVVCTIIYIVFVFQESLITNLYRLIQKLKPDKKKRKKEGKAKRFAAHYVIIFQVAVFIC